MNFLTGQNYSSPALRYEGMKKFFSINSGQDVSSFVDILETKKTILKICLMQDFIDMFGSNSLSFIIGGQFNVFQIQGLTKQFIFQSLVQREQLLSHLHEQTGNCEIKSVLLILATCFTLSMRISIV
uniref:PPUP9104 n=1 Tax=Poeciliopsis prolifica TaxID=188132 RepID=A0A0S7EPH2_9TELE